MEKSDVCKLYDLKDYYMSYHSGSKPFIDALETKLTSHNFQLAEDNGNIAQSMNRAQVIICCLTSGYYRHIFGHDQQDKNYFEFRNMFAKWPHNTVLFLVLEQGLDTKKIEHYLKSDTKDAQFIDCSGVTNSDALDSVVERLTVAIKVCTLEMY